MWACTGAPRSMYWGPRSMYWAPLLCTEPAWAPLYVAGAARCTIGRCGQLASRRRTMTAAALWRRLLWRRCSMAALHYGGWYDAARCPIRRRGAVTVSAPYYACMCLWRRCTMGATAHMVAPPHYGGAAARCRHCTMATAGVMRLAARWRHCL